MLLHIHKDKTDQHKTKTFILNEKSKMLGLMAKKKKIRNQS